MNKQHKSKRKAFNEMKKELYLLFQKETNPKLKELRKKIYDKFVKKRLDLSYDYNPEGDFEW